MAVIFTTATAHIQFLFYCSFGFFQFFLKAITINITPPFFTFITLFCVKGRYKNSRSYNKTAAFHRSLILSMGNSYLRVLLQDV